MIPTIETISVVCLTGDQEDGDLILDLVVIGTGFIGSRKYNLFQDKQAFIVIGVSIVDDNRDIIIRLVFFHYQRKTIT